VRVRLTLCTQEKAAPRRGRADASGLKVAASWVGMQRLAHQRPWTQRPRLHDVRRVGNASRVAYVHWMERATTSPSRKLGYIPALDGLRGVAVTLVVLHHADLLPGGYIGVDVFFVLSGFLITSLLLEEHEARGSISLTGFYMRRARRILPALAAVLLGYLAVVALSGGTGFRAVVLAGLFSGNAVQAFVVPNPLAHAGLGLGHLWSLAEEEQFYLLWPVALIVLARTRRLVPALALVLTAVLVWKGLLAAHGARFDRIYYGPDTHADGLLAGALLAALRWWKPLRVPEPIPVLSFALFFVGSMIGPLSDAGWLYIWPFLLLGCVGMTAAAATDTRMAALLSVRPLVGLGRMSYSLYLWHWPIMVGIAYRFHARHALLAILLSVPAAWVSYRFVERPFRRARPTMGRARLSVA
jgi:peptidoglycan/LPS O-acetylase OafA/YrhL